MESAEAVTKLYGSGQRATRVVDNATLIHEQQRAGIMVTHDLRMCKYLAKS